MTHAKQHYMSDIKTIAAILASLLMTACNDKMKFSAESVAGNDTSLSVTEDELSQSFKLNESQQTLTQTSLEKNISTISFQVKKTDGQYLQSLSAADISVLENSIGIPNFLISKNTLETKQTVDIAFAVDVTGSMSSTIESAKLRLINFVKKSRESGYHTRMCLITFGDYTVQKCDKFYDNNPADSTTLSQVEELISEITKLKALTGKQDPGGKDLNENPMRAVIDAANADWSTQNQRFLILITDDGFLYSPGNQGTQGANAPKYTEVKDALAKSQVKVFAATPSLAGYNKAFGKDAGIVSLSQGEWFNFADLISGQITLDTILNRIITNVNTTFVVEYVVDEVPGLNAALPVASRTVTVALNDSTLGTVESVQLKSNLPNGRENYKSEFNLTSKKIKKDSVVVTINGIEIKLGFAISDDGKIKFDKAPLAGALIKVAYKYAQLKDSLSITPITLGQRVDPKSLVVEFNGAPVTAADYKVEKTIEGKYSVILADRVLDDSDPYKIFKNNGLHIRIKFSYVN